jgi:hypothetical protein
VNIKRTAIVDCQAGSLLAFTDERSGAPAGRRQEVQLLTGLSGLEQLV